MFLVIEQVFWGSVCDCFWFFLINDNLDVLFEMERIACIHCSGTHPIRHVMIMCIGVMLVYVYMSRVCCGLIITCHAGGVFSQYKSFCLLHHSEWDFGRMLSVWSDFVLHRFGNDICSMVLFLWWFIGIGLVLFYFLFHHCFIFVCSNTKLVWRCMLFLVCFFYTFSEI